MRARPILVLWRVRGQWRFDYFKPETVLTSIKTPEHLKATLTALAEPGAGMGHGTSALQRRHHVERVRPALRWFCRVHHRRVPRWLRVESDARYFGLPAEVHARLFGRRALTVREFRAWRSRGTKATLLPVTPK